MPVGQGTAGRELVVVELEVVERLERGKFRLVGLPALRM